MNLVSNPARDFLKVAAPYFQSEDRWHAWGLLASIVIVELALVYLFVLTNEWNVLFYNSLQDRNWNAFLWSLVVFLGLATAMVVLVGAQYFLGQSLMIRWREWMTRRYLENWLAQSRLYRVQFVHPTVDNIHLRIASDVQLFIQYTLELGTGLLSSIVTLGSFVVILWELSSLTPLTALGFDVAIPGYLVWIALLYAAMGTFVAHLIGRPLIALDFDSRLPLRDSTRGGSCRADRHDGRRVGRTRHAYRPIRRTGHQLEESRVATMATGHVRHQLRAGFHSLSVSGGEPSLFLGRSVAGRPDADGVCVPAC
jgi:putative ATP-binding cassette transporter